MLPHRIRVHAAHLPGVLLRTGRAYRRNARPTYPDGGSAWAIQTCRLSPANGRARSPRGQDSAAPFGDVHSIAVDETWELKRSWISGPVWPCPPTAFRRPIRRASNSQSFPVHGPNQDGTGQIDAVGDVVDPSRMGGSTPRNVVSGLVVLRSGEPAR